MMDTDKLGVEEELTAEVSMQAEKLRSELRETRAALESVEWMPLATHVGIMCCPWCLSSRKLGHSVDCQRQAALREGTECNHECNHSAFNWDLVYRCRGCGAVLLEETCEATLEKHTAQIAEECAGIVEKYIPKPQPSPAHAAAGCLCRAIANAIRKRFCQDK